MSNPPDSGSGRPPGPPRPPGAPGSSTAIPRQTAATAPKPPGAIPRPPGAPGAPIPTAPAVPAVPSVAPVAPTAGGQWIDVPGIGRVWKPDDPNVAAAPPAVPAVAPLMPAVAPAVAPVKPTTGVAPAFVPAVAPAKPATGTNAAFVPSVAPVAPVAAQKPGSWPPNAAMSVAPAVPAIAPVAAAAIPRPPGAPGGAPAAVRAPAIPAGTQSGLRANMAPAPASATRPPGIPTGSQSGVRSPFAPPQIAPPVAAAARPPTIAPGTQSGVRPPPAPATPALGEFDPFASDSVKALVGEAAPPGSAAAAPAAPAPPAPLPAQTSTLVMPPPAFPPSGAIETTVSPEHAAAVAKVTAVLDELDYFQVLRIGFEAGPAEIKKAFYRESRVYHPDRFYHLPDDPVKTDIGNIYKRITEAYYFLRDDLKRKKYLADITGPDRRAKLRFSELSEAETKAQVKKEAEEQIGTHPKGRAFYATAMGDMNAKNWGAAQRNLKMALTYEASNPRYKEKLAEVEQKLHEEYKSSGDKFKIK